MSIRRSFAALIFVLLAPSISRAEDEPAPVPAPAPGACLSFSDSAPSSALSSGLRSMTFAVGDAAQPLTEIELLGLTTIDPERLWQLLGGRPTTALTAEHATVLVARLAETGLFASITPLLRLAPDGSGATLEITLVEHPTLEAVEIHGLSELTREEILDALFGGPYAADSGDGDAVGADVHVEHRRHERVAVIRVVHRDDDHASSPSASLRCPAPEPPAAWLARHRDGHVRAGIVHGGVGPAVTRVQRLLAAEGYLLARVTASFTPDGTLRLDVDEGRLAAIDVAGVAPELREEVLSLLGLSTSLPFNVEDLHGGRARVRARFPFLRVARARRAAPPSFTLVETAEDGADGAPGVRRFSFAPGPARCADDFGDAGDWSRSDSFAIDDYVISIRGERAPDEDDDTELCTTRRSWYELDGKKLTVHFRFDRVGVDADGVELLRHTPVTGFSPGLLFRLRAWDPADRVHFRFDTLFNVNTARESRDATADGALGELAAAQRVDFLVSPSLSIPAIGLTELGVATYALTDTDDGWRVARIDAYLNSMLFGRPEQDYYRRAGLSAFATFHVAETLTLGAEYRYDRHQTLVPLAPGDADIIISDDPDHENPAIDDGVYGSLLLRVEWSTASSSPYAVEATRRRRPAQGSLLSRAGGWDVESGLTTVATFELADPALGGDGGFWRLVADSVLTLATGDESGVILRVRGAGGDDLPVQRQEALGGWGSLRGFGFKELGGGDLSFLGTLEYRFAVLSAFADAGAVRVAGDFLGPKLGLGLALNLGDGQLAFAWRTDDQAEAAPEIRLLFGRAW